jgi:general stress protein 26
MPIEEMWDFAGKNSLAYMATVEGDRPKVRAMNMWKADAGGFYFHNNKKLDIWNQVSNNSWAHLLFVAPGGAKSLHVEGKLEFVPGEAAAKEFYAVRGKGGFEPRGALNPAITPVIFRMAHGTAWYNPERVPKGKRVDAIEKVAF